MTANMTSRQDLLEIINLMGQSLKNLENMFENLLNVKITELEEQQRESEHKIQVLSEEVLKSKETKEFRHI